MARAAEAPSLPLSFARGIHNRSRETDTPEGFAREVENLDIWPSGTLTQRAGLTAVGGLSGGHSLWSWPGFPGWLYVSGAALIYVSPALGGSTVATVTRGLPISYCYVSGAVYYSNGVDMGIVRADGTFRRWGFSAPPAPVLSQVAGGLPAGRYHVAWTAVYDDGEESPPSAASLITTTADSNIQISAVPSATGATAMRVYRTTQDGETLYHAVTVALPFAGALTLGSADLGTPLATMYHTTMRPGAPLALLNRRIYAASGRYLRYSSDLQFSVTRRHSGWMPFPEAIRMVGAVTDGLYVGTGAAVYWVPGPDPLEASRTVVDRYGCQSQPNQAWIPGSAFPEQGIPPMGPVVAWVSLDGSLCIGRPGGFVQRVTEGTAALPSAGRVSMGFFDAGGLRQLRISLDGSSANSRAAIAEVVANTYQQGVTLTD